LENSAVVKRFVLKMLDVKQITMMLRPFIIRAPVLMHASYRSPLIDDIKLPDSFPPKKTSP
jgi:hypothetical protein